MKYFSQALLFLFSIAVLCVLQYQLWFGENGRSEYARLTIQLNEQKRLNEEQIEQNRVLKADVKDLKSGLEAVEEHARLDLGYIKPGETFVQMSTASVTIKDNFNDLSQEDETALEEIPLPYLPN